MLHQKRLSNRGFRGFTLVELLVVIAIIGILVALLLPAVNAAREAARRATCLNQLKQMGLAALNYESAKKLLPSGGWGYRWVGDPNLGYGARQPGSWQFSILPYMEGQALRDAALGASDPAAKANLLKRMIATPVSDFQCPSRPSSPGVYRQSKENAQPLVNAAALTDGVDLLGRSDYAANAGDADLGHARIGGGSDPGPANLAGVDAYAWFHSAAAMLARTSSLNPKPPFPYNGPTGVIFQRSEIALKDISDGTSKTYLMGEKFLDPRSYSEQGFVDMAVNNDQSLFTGGSSDNLRLTSDRINSTYLGWQPSKDKILTKGTGTNLQEINCTVDDNWSFGSVHAAGFQAVMCDGAARSIPFGVARRVHRLLGSRADEELLEENF